MSMRFTVFLFFLITEMLIAFPVEKDVPRKNHPLTEEIAIDQMDARIFRKQSILFIINPISGGLKKINIEKMIAKNLDKNRFDYSVVYTKYSGHANELARDAILRNIDIVAVVGGDGTVNEVGKALINTETKMAIIPAGSGNGLARSLHIPLEVTDSLLAINHSSTIVMDTAKINDEVFLTTAGIGFDAEVALKFADFGKRGLSSYIQVALKEFPHYQPKKYDLIVDGKPYPSQAFIMSFANATQYGNDFIIAPGAKLQDGYLDLVIVKEVPFYYIPKFLYRSKQGTLDHSSVVEEIKCKEVVLRQKNIQAHIDGEPIAFEKEIKVAICPASLKVIIPQEEGVTMREKIGRRLPARKVVY